MRLADVRVVRVRVLKNQVDSGSATDPTGRRLREDGQRLRLLLEIRLQGRRIWVSRKRVRLEFLDQIQRRERVGLTHVLKIPFPEP